METVKYRIETTLRDDLGLTLCLEHVQGFTMGKGDPNSPDFIPGNVSGRFRTRVRVGDVKMYIDHIALHPSMEQALPMWAGAVRREMDKLETGNYMLVKPSEIKTIKDFATAILLTAKEEEKKPY